MNGGTRIQGATQQWSDADGTVRMQAGRDAKGDFTFSLFDETGKGILIDATGIKPDAIADGLIVNKMVADNAGIGRFQTGYPFCDKRDQRKLPEYQEQPDLV